MDCKHTLKNYDNFQDRSLSAADTLDLQSHLDSCPSCREAFRQDDEMIAALRDLPVPPPSKDFTKRSFATARARHKTQSIKQILPVWGGAVAACLAFWIIMAAPLSQTPQTAQPAINIRLNQQRLVQVIVNAPRELLHADVIIELPPHVEVAGFPGQKEIRWSTNLRKGKNLLSLPIIAKSEGVAELIAHINHENKSKVLSLVMKVSHDELTGTGHSAAKSA